MFDLRRNIDVQYMAAPLVLLLGLLLAFLPAIAADPKPQFFGVYAVNGGRLTELLPPEGRQQYEPGDVTITDPAKAHFSDGKISFLVYRRDVTTSAPEFVNVLIEARVARTVAVDFNKRITKVTPVSGVWKLRIYGYKLRVKPRANRDTIIIQSATPDFSFASGRYALQFNNADYEFVVGSETTADRQHCVDQIVMGGNISYHECETAAELNLETSDGRNIYTKNFKHDSQTIKSSKDPGYYYVGYNLDAGLPDPAASNYPPFIIQFTDADQSFDVVLMKQPLAQIRTQSEQYLMAHLGLSQSQLCRLKYKVEVNNAVGSFTYQNVKFSFCAGAVQL